MFTAVNSSEVQSVPTLSIMLGNADVDFEFLLPCSFGLRLPLDGIRANQSSLKASPSASRGKITPTSIATTQAVGSFVDTPTIFCAGNAGEPANISIWLASEMQLMVADTISFRLPAFRKLVRVHGMTAPTNSKLLADSGQASATGEIQRRGMTIDWCHLQKLVKARGGFDDCSAAKTRAEVSRELGFDCKVYTDTASQLTNLWKEVGLGQEDHTKRQSHRSSGIQKTKRSSTGGKSSTEDKTRQHVNVPNITFNRSVMRHRNVTQQHNIPVRQNFTVTSGLADTNCTHEEPEERDVLMVKDVPVLEQYTSKEMAFEWRNVTNTVQSLAKFDVEFYDEFDIMVMTSLESIPCFGMTWREAGGSHKKVTVPLDQAIRLPVQGILPNSHGFQIYVTIGGKSLNPLQITEFPDKRALMNASLQFPGGRANQRVDIVVEFDSRVPYYLVDVFLPGFTGADTADIAGVVPQPSSVITSASWVSHTSTLKLSSNSMVEVETGINVTIPISAGIKLPSRGIHAMRTNFTIASGITRAVLDAMPTVTALSSFCRGNI